MYFLVICHIRIAPLQNTDINGKTGFLYGLDSFVSQLKMRDGKSE